jgi:argininosuccinate lyase
METSLDFFRLVTGAIETLTVNRELMLERARENWTTASNLADAISRHADLSFREAHGIVGRVVRTAVADRVTPLELTSIHVDAAAEAVIGRALGIGTEVIREALDPVRFVETRATYGSVNPVEVERMLAEAGERLGADREWVEERLGAVEEAHRALAEEVDRRLVP